MARLVLHIGTHKTGTTMIQNNLHAAREDLADQGVIYPDAGAHTGHHWALTDWIALPAAYARAGGGIAGLRRLADRWRGTDVTILLSSEELSRAGGRGGRVDHSALRGIFDGYDIRVICVLRSPWQFLQAVYIELSHTAPPPPPAEIVADALRTGQVDGLWCDFLRLYDGLRDHYAAEEIRLVDYGRHARSPDGLITEVLRLAAPRLTVPNKGDGKPRANASPTPIPIWAAHVVAGGPSPGPDIRAAAQEAYELEYGAGRPGCIFTRRELDDLCSCFDTINDRLANRVRTIQPGWCLSAQSPADGTIYREDIHPDYWIRLARRLAMRGMRDAA